MRFSITPLILALTSGGLLAAASETLDLRYKCDSFGGVIEWVCLPDQAAGVACAQVYHGGGSHCSDCAKLDTPGLFSCTCSGDSCP
ncbi:hypothetical protein B0J12DRAFT_786304 [Macrophomina phaseolina]|uniref:Uncharacterized protein n=1 Tax=Macrophomina phaseolina TaxID=35725 RepID=A0ABQ8G8Y4_9PEZI|nr:hypothetical protein B0J12DRAFT_786304 [Macrophomina phaseolina]